MNCSKPPTTTSSRLNRASRTRGWLAGAAALACLLWALPATAKTLKIATSSPDGSSWMKVLREAIKEVEAATDDRVSFKVIPGGSAGDDSIVLRKMRQRQLHGGLLTAAVFNTRYKDIQVYNLPMAFRNFAEVDAVRQAMDPLLMAGLAEVGFETFGIAEVGMAYAMSKKKAQAVADGSRLKVWQPDGDIAAERTLRAFGITPIPLTIADVNTGLQAGIIDTVVVPPVAVLPLQWHTRLKHLLDLPLMYIYGLFVVQADALSGIDAEDLAATRRIMAAAVAKADRMNRADHDAAWQALANQGLQIVKPTAAEVQEWQSYAAAASEAWVEEGLVGAEIYATLQQKLAEIRGGATSATNNGGRPAGR